MAEKKSNNDVIPMKKAITIIVSLVALIVIVVGSGVYFLFIHNDSVSDSNVPTNDLVGVWEHSKYTYSDDLFKMYEFLNDGKFSRFAGVQKYGGTAYVAIGTYSIEDDVITLTYEKEFRFGRHQDYEWKEFENDEIEIFTYSFRSNNYTLDLTKENSNTSESYRDTGSNILSPFVDRYDYWIRNRIDSSYYYKEHLQIP